MDESKASFLIIKHKHGTLDGTEVRIVVRGIDSAERLVDKFNQENDGWRYYHERTTLTAGTDPAFATKWWWWQRFHIHRDNAHRLTKRDLKLAGRLRKLRESREKNTADAER